MINAEAERRLAFRVHPALPWLVLSPGVLAELLLEPAWCGLPGASVGIHGAANVRGAVYPVFDLLPSLGYPPAQAARLLLVEAGPFGAAMATFGEPRVGMWSKDAASANALVPESIRPFVREVGQLDGETAWHIDHRRWFAELGGGQNVAA